MDHCTAFPDRILSWDLAPCCMAHDLAYGLGLPKGAADVQLYQCVLETTGSAPLAAVMLIGVTFGGWLFYRRTKR